MKSKLLLIAAVALAVGGCNRPEPDRTMPDRTTSLLPRIGSVDTTSFITPLAAPERTPISPDANAAAPGTNASLAFANNATGASAKLSPDKDDSPEAQRIAVAAQEAAAKAPDTAAADAAKRRAYEDYAANNTSHEMLASAPLGTLIEESSKTPMGQSNDASSTALDKPSNISLPSSPNT